MTTSRDAAPDTPPHTPPGSPPVARIGSPGELALVIPELLGFRPAESLIVVALGEPRGRLGLIQRIDLPPDDQPMPRRVADEIVSRVVRDGGTRAVVVIWTEQADRGAELPWAHLVEALADAALRAGLDAPESILVRGGRWWSYCCTRGCCPEDGTELRKSQAAESVSLVTVERALSGRVVFGSREELAESIAPVLPPLGRGVRDQALADAAERSLAGACADLSGWRAEMLTRYRAAMRDLADPRFRLADQEACDLVVALSDVPLRDCVLVEALEHGAALQHLLETLCRHALPPFDAPVCAILAWLCHARGDGTLASIAAERALDDDPIYSAAHLVLDALESAVPPEVMRSSIAACREETYATAGLDASGQRPRSKRAGAAARRSRPRAR